MRKLILSIVLFISTFHSSFAQSGIRDSMIHFPFMGFSFGVYAPGGDLAERYGLAAIISGDLHYKTKKNLVYGISAGFIFGNDVKIDYLFKGISTADGHIIGLDGLYADVRTFQRGYHISATFGKIFTFKKPNPNSGIIVSGGPGFLQHKIKIDPIGNTVPELRGDYKKGYDHLTNGLQIREFIGFISFGNRQLINFYGGFEFMQGFTSGRRDYTFNEPGVKDDNRLDLMYGFKIGWVLPFYKKKPAQYYMY